MRRALVLLIFFIVPEGTNYCFAQTLPIKPTRTISFTTNEGSYMNLDISPDGKTLVFDLLGDIYTLPVTGGKATQLTRGMAINRYPIWSHDGRKIAYVSDFSGVKLINVRNITGTLHVVLERTGYQLMGSPIGIHSFCWTPDGNYIAANDSLYGLTGGSLSLPPDIKQPLLFSPDGQRVYYAKRDSVVQYDLIKKSKITRSAIFSQNVNYYANGHYCVMAHDVGGTTISPDGHWWAFVADSNRKTCLMIQDLSTQAKRILVASFTNQQFYSFNRHYAFSPDSKELFISYGGKIHRINAISGVDHIIPFTADVHVDMGPLNYHTFRVTQNPLKVKYTRSANASPDGKHVVFSALNKVYVMDLPNGKPHLLVKQPFNQFQPIYSPDGKWIAYVSWCDTTGGFLWRVPASGGKPLRLTRVPGQYQRPAWSPDGTHIAVIAGYPELESGEDAQNIGSLVLVPVNGGPVKTVSDTVSFSNQISFSESGGNIIYEPYKGNDYLPPAGPMIVSKNLYSGKTDTLANGWYYLSNLRSFAQGALQQRTVSPDGRFIVYSMGEDLYLVPVTRLIDSTILYDSRKKIQAIRFAAGLDPSWSNDCRTLSWSYGSQFYQVNPDKIMENAELVKQRNDHSGMPESNFLTAWVKPDKVVNLNLSVPKFYGHGTIALKNVRIVTMKGSKVIENGTLLIKDGRFIAVGPAGTIRVPNDAKVIDLTGKTTMPGLVDMHLHMNSLQDIFPQQYWVPLADLAYGVTTARDPSTTYDSFGYGELLEAGQMIGPRFYSTGRAVYLGNAGAIKLDNLNDAREIVAKRKLLGSTFMKQYDLQNRNRREWLLQASKEAGMNMTNEGEDDPILALGQFKDGSSGVEHNAIWDEAYGDIIKVLAKSGTYFTPTLQVRADKPGPYFLYKYWYKPDPKMLHFFPDVFLAYSRTKFKDTTFGPNSLNVDRVDAKIRNAGGHVLLGSHGNVRGFGAQIELWALQMGGLTNMQALQAATIMGARGLGIQKDVGSIEAGKIADLIILNKNPLDDIHNSREIKYVMKNGVLYDGNTMDELWPVYRKCPDWRMHGKNAANDKTNPPKNLHQNHEEDEQE